MVTRPGDGLRKPLNAPPAGQVGYGIQPGSPGIVIAHFIIVTTAGGVFIYSGAPAHGNPPIAWMSGGTTDPYGNTLPSTTGIASSGTFTAGNTVTSTSGTVSYSAAPAANNMFSSDAPAAFTDAFGNAVLAGITTYFHGGVYFALQHHAGEIDGYTASSQAGPWTLVNQVSWSIADGNGVYYSTFSQPIDATGGTPASPTLITTDVWNAMTLVNSWANAGGNVAAQYRLTTDNQVEIIGTLAAASATNAVFFTLPAGPPSYRPASQQQFACGATGGVGAAAAPFVQCTTGGALSIQHATIGAADTYVFHGFISLDA